MGLMEILKFLILIMFSSFNVHADLPVLHVDTNAISVSGISSGAAMATQLHVAFSSSFMGAGIIAGVPNMCTPAVTCMTTPYLISVAALEGATAMAASLGNIDSTSNLRHDRVWVFAGTEDTVVNPGAGQKVVDYYRYYLNCPSQVKFVNALTAEHGQITNNFGGKCEDLNTNNFMNNCNYSAAFNLLDHIYGNLTQPNPDYVFDGELSSFNQTSYASSLALMDSTGYIYVPRRCKDGPKVCKLHVALHGCKMGRTYIGDTYVRHAGYNEVADLNDIVVLYPQVKASLFNPNGCWDWFAYTGPYYAVKKGHQMQSIHQMVQHVSGK